MSYLFELTPSIVRNIQQIERVRESVKLSILPPATAEILRFQAHIRSTHYSTRIEGNRLTLKETEMVVQQGKFFPGRERDVKEVERYYKALQQMEKWVEGKREITEGRIRKLHAILYSGRKTKPTPYRDGQNVIRESDGRIVYMPPEAPDVPKLMKELVHWIHSTAQELPIPVIAGVAHYQFETIHPFFDGNGRTGRMLTTWILYQSGYDLGKFYALEEFYATNLEAYYSALVTHPHHNYYFGRHEANITSWLEYFLKGMAVVFERVNEKVRGERSTTIRITHQRQLEMPTQGAQKAVKLLSKKREGERKHDGNRRPSEATNERTKPRQDTGTGSCQSESAQQKDGRKIRKAGKTTQ